MSRDIKVDMIFGFIARIELNKEEHDILNSIGLAASPLLYTTEDKTDQYIVGKKIMSLSGAGQFNSLKFNPSEEEKKTLQEDILKKLDEVGFDVKDKPFDTYVNTYYY